MKMRKRKPLRKQLNACTQTERLIPVSAFSQGPCVEQDDPFSMPLRGVQFPSFALCSGTLARFWTNSFSLVLGWLQDEHNPPINEEEEAHVIQQTERLWKSVQPWLRGSAANPESFWGRLHEWGDALTRNDSAAYNVRGCLYDFLAFCGIAVDKDSTQLSIALGISTQIIRAVEEIHRRRLIGSPRKSARNVVREIVYALRENADELGESIPIDADVDAVVLTTVHQSKGLEWPVVFLPTLNKRRFPVNPRGHGTSFPDEIAARYGTTTEDEWRLFYVAASRSMERLFLFDFANGDSDKQSPFLNALHSAIWANTPLNHTAFDKDVMTLTPDELKGTGDLPVRVGLSDLLIYIECPFQFALRRLIGIQPAIADDLGYGKGIHEVAAKDEATMTSLGLRPKLRTKSMQMFICHTWEKSNWKRLRRRSGREFPRCKRSGRLTGNLFLR